MSDHFAAFSFVDRITEFAPGRRARGTLRGTGGPRRRSRRASSPRRSASSPRGSRWRTSTFAAGRSRRWRARRGFCATSGRVRRSLLAVEIERCDDEAVAYRGSAHVDGALLIELIDCLGPMLPVEEFDAPAALSASASRCCAVAGAAAGALPRRRGAAHRRRQRSSRENRRRATLHVPTAAPFFADHFPRRPVFPATLLLDAQIGLAMQLARSADTFAGDRRASDADDQCQGARVHGAGRRARPRAELQPIDERTARIALTARANGKLGRDRAHRRRRAGVSP